MSVVRSGGLMGSILFVLYIVAPGLQVVCLVLIELAIWREAHRLVGVSGRSTLWLGATTGTALFLATATHWWSPRLTVSIWVVALLAALSDAVRNKRLALNIEQHHRWTFGLAVGLFSTGPLSAIWYFQLPQGHALLALIILSTWGGDFGAGVSGPLTARLCRTSHPVWSWANPRKTWEGHVVGSLVLVVLALSFGWLFRVPIAVPGLLILSMVAALTRPIGDALESALKRIADTKHSGSITALPGRGGVLDLVDSLALTLPIVVTVYEFLQSYTHVTNTCLC